MSSQSIPLRHIPAEVVEVADAIARHTGLSLAAVYRLALASGMLVEATKITPDHGGTYAGLDGEYLAKALRRHLSSAIDLLLAYGEYPAATRLSPPPPGQATGSDHSVLPSNELEQEQPFDPSIGDDLESLGIGLGLSEQ